MSPGSVKVQSQIGHRRHLGESDRGVLLMRRRMLDQAKLVADGGEPKGLIRDPEKNHSVYLPRVGGTEVNFGAEGATAPRNRHLYGQPQEVLDEMDRIWADRAKALT